MKVRGERREPKAKGLLFFLKTFFLFFFFDKTVSLTFSWESKNNLFKKLRKTIIKRGRELKMFLLKWPRRSLWTLQNRPICIPLLEYILYKVTSSKSLIFHPLDTQQHTGKQAKTSCYSSSRSWGEVEGHEQVFQLEWFFISQKLGAAFRIKTSIKTSLFLDFSCFNSFIALHLAAPLKVGQGHS